MPAIICHHIFGEDAATSLPEGMLEGEEELLAFLLGNQGPDPLFARFSTPPSRARSVHELGHRMHDGRCDKALASFRSGVEHLPRADERIGRAFVLGLLAHYRLDSICHPFVFAQQEALAAADPSLAGSQNELHALIESDIDSWILWEKRRVTVLERPAHANLMRTDRIGRVAGALFSQAALGVYGVGLGAGEYAAAVDDYELEYRLLDPAGGPVARMAGAFERMARPHSFAEAMAHRVVRSCDCAAANLEGRPWMDPSSGEERHESFADLFDAALMGYPEAAEAFVRGNLSVTVDYNGRPLS